jgi:Flp pilus assembly protein TadG
MKAARTESGAVIVEFALVMPLLLLLVFGFLQLGVALHAKINSTHLTAEGARWIAVNQNPGLSQATPTTMENYIRSRAATNFLKTATVCIDYPLNLANNPATSGQVGDPVRVRMVRDNYSLIPLVGQALGPSPGLASLKVVAQTTMRLEARPTNIPATAGCSIP